MNRSFSINEFNKLVVLYVLYMARQKEELLESGMEINNDLYEILAHISMRNFTSQETRLIMSDSMVNVSIGEMKNSLKDSKDFRIVI